MFGSPVKPVPFVAALVPILAAAVLVAALGNGLAWYNAVGLFYGALAFAELVYLATTFVVSEARLPALHERRAKTGAVE